MTIGETKDVLRQLREALERMNDKIEQHVEDMAQEVAHFSYLVGELEREHPFVDAREVAHEYNAMRSLGRDHDQAIAELGVRYERPPRKVEHLLRAARVLERIMTERQKKKS